MVGQRALYPGNGAGDRSQTWSKVSSKVVLLKYSAIAIFAKIAIWRVFPDTVTFIQCSCLLRVAEKAKKRGSVKQELMSHRQNYLPRLLIPALEVANTIPDVNTGFHVLLAHMTLCKIYSKCV